MESHRISGGNSARESDHRPLNTRGRVFLSVNLTISKLIYHRAIRFRFIEEIVYAEIANERYDVTPYRVTRRITRIFAITRRRATKFRYYKYAGQGVRKAAIYIR